MKINLQYTTFSELLPDFIYEDLRDFSKHANGYRPQPETLLEKLAEKYNLPKEMIYLTVGADEAIQMFALAYGQRAFIFTPTYVVYSDMYEFTATVTQRYSLVDNTYSISPDPIHDATLIYLANPNNPFGYTDKETVLQLVKNNPQAIVVVDEVYAEFADLSVLQEVKNYPNLVVLRSFSKSYGMAGNRIGFIVAKPEIIAKVRTKTQWSNVSYLSVGAAMSALEHEDYFVNLRKAICDRRDEFANFLKKNGLVVLPSRINAVLLRFRTENDGSHFAQFLNENDFVVSHGNGNSNVGLNKSFVRISIGTEEEMKKVKRVISSYQ